MTPGQRTTDMPTRHAATTGPVPTPVSDPLHAHEPVTDVLDSSGQTLDTSVRESMEAKFRSDFSHVRVHTDATASQSALMLNARAYTVGTDIVFGAGEYEPHTADGRKLLAHELSHVVQQSGASHQTATASPATAEQEAGRLSHAIESSASVRVSARAPVGAIQRQGNKNPKDDTAKAIIARAKDTKTAAPDRAVQLIKDIVATYYPGDAAKVDTIVFDNEKAKTGLTTGSVGSGAKAKGKIYVGDAFLDNVDSFARRVLQVGHELQHVDQYRTGLAGDQHKHMREFLAFHDGAFAEEKAGTGRVDKGTRRNLIDEALKNFYCLTTDEQKDNAGKKEALLKRRAEINDKAGEGPTEPPTSSCQK